MNNDPVDNNPYKLCEEISSVPVVVVVALLLQACSGDGSTTQHTHEKTTTTRVFMLTNRRSSPAVDQTHVNEAAEDAKGYHGRSSLRMQSVRLLVLLLLCLQNSLFTVLRRYSKGILKEEYSSYELLLMGEVIKFLFSAYMVVRSQPSSNDSWTGRLVFLVQHSRKMLVLALIYGVMNILSFVSLRNIGAGMFTIFSQCKILTTATFSALLLQRHYSATKWRALTALVFGVLLFSEPIWGDSHNLLSNHADANPLLGTIAVLVEVSLSGFASIYFEKVVKSDASNYTIWERNFQLALGSFPVYLLFILADSPQGPGSGWSWLTVLISFIGAAGGLLVALSIKYGDSILKTLATTGAIVLSSLLDHFFLEGPLTPIMVIAGVQVVLAICNYTFDATPVQPEMTIPESSKIEDDEEQVALVNRNE